ncbi:putative nucleotidyltransferase, Ribonuclease H [Helianthus annuus]|nr:putative nucleotidyltransferase, Ribonuclease H [Helianthus annuus]
MPPRKDTSASDDLPPTATDQLNQLISITTNAATTQANLTAQITALTENTARLINHVATLTDRLTPGSDDDDSVKPIANPNPPRNPRPPKIQLPMFDGTNPLGWIFQAENYFTYYQIPPQERITLTAFHFVGDALTWYQNQSTNGLLGNWPAFKRSVELRFGPSTFDNHEATLFKLQQKTTVPEYQTEFERLSNRITGLSARTLLNCFISGLKPEIQAEMAIIKPNTFEEACGLARRIEDKFNHLFKTKPPYPTKSYSSTNFPTTSATPITTMSSTTTNPTKPVTMTPSATTTPPLLPSPPKTLPFTKLSPEAIQQRRKDGLCFRCPEKFFPGHKCSPPQFMLIVDNEDQLEPLDDPPDQQTDNVSPPQFMSLSDAAYFGMSSLQTLRITGYINGTPVTVLVDCGSTHNIIQPRIASLLGLPTKPLQPFAVMVGNGEHIYCQGHCPNVPLLLQKAAFQVPFFVFPVQGADVVLGISWLGTLGSITADFSVPKISFNINGNTTTLTGEPMTKQVTSSSLSSMLRHGSIASLHALLLEPPHNATATTDNLSHTDPIITNLLTDFQSVFATPHNLPPSRPHDHRIPLLDESKPVNVKPYRYPHFQKQVMTQLIDEMLRDGIIRPSQSPFSSPVLLVKKKDGTWRFCVDYRALNAVTTRDRFPIPTIDELLDELNGATIFSKIDLRSGYHQIRVAQNDIHKTAFRTSDGHYEFLVMPFGLTNAPSTFQSAMNDLFRSVLRKFVLASKCVFAVHDISFLGHRISGNGVRPEPEKIVSIQQWPKPVSFTTLRAFLGITGYYRPFVPQYAHIATPLTDILKAKEFLWNDKAETAFTTLKTHMQNLITLALPDFSKLFDLTTDASGYAIGAVLSQNNRPIAFFSKKLCPTMQAQSTYTKELYAITESVRKWRQYLLGSRFRIFTDHHSLKHMLTQTIHTPEQQKWITKLLGYDFEIHFKPGKENTVADALSRVQIPPMMALSHVTAPWLSEIKLYYKEHPSGIELIDRVTSDPTAFPHHLYKDGLVYVRGKILVPPIGSIRENLLQEFHSSLVGGHSGSTATFKRLSASFSWLGLKKDVITFVRNCEICQAIKIPTHKPYGLLQPLPVPDHTWHDISMDFITNLPPSKGKTVIWVIVDRLSKFAHFIALPTHYTAVSLAAIFMKEIYKLHGLPKTIVSDRDPIFVSRFWRELFKQMGTQLLHSSAYHPQTDGQTEVVNRCLEAYLRVFVFDTPSRWERYLHMAEFSYNTNFHSSIGMTPFKALYGHEATSVHDYIPGTNSNASIDMSLSSHQEVIEALKTSLEVARGRMVKQANKHRLEKEFDIGDWVYLKLQPYRQQTVSSRSNNKLSRRFFGPYKIIDRIGKVAYKLELPPSSKIHPVFHVSLLKQSYGNIASNKGNIEAFNDQTVSFLPEAVLNKRLGTENQEQLLIQWENRPLEEATWEDKSVIQQQFPFFLDVEDNIGLEEEGDDTDQVGPSAKQAQLQHNVNDRPKRQVKKPKRLME